MYIEREYYYSIYQAFWPPHREAPSAVPRPLHPMAEAAVPRRAPEFKLPQQRTLVAIYNRNYIYKYDYELINYITI